MTSFLTHQVAGHGLLAVFVLMVLESACIPIPSEVIMLFGGALAGGLLATHGHAHVTLLGVGLAGALGNLVGSLVAYGVGRAGGRPLLERHGGLVHLTPARLARTEAFFARRGDAAVLVGRVLPLIRTFISLPAGVSGMPVGRFAAFTLLGCLPWTFALAAAGDALAANWDSITGWFTAIGIVIAVAVVVAAVVALRRSRRAAPAG